MSTARRSPARKATPGPLGPGPPTWVLLATLTALVWIVHRHVLRGYFALDDLILFQQAEGIRPWPITLWRWLSGWAWFRVVVPLWGHEPLPYHVVSLVLHSANAMLLFLLARRWGARALAAWLAVGLFAASRLVFPALLAITAVGELLSLTGLLAALLLAGPPLRLVPAIAALVLAVSAKESVMLVAFAAVFAWGNGENVRTRTQALGPLLGAGVAAGIVLLGFGMASGRLGGQAYAFSFGTNLLENIARLFGWSMDLLDPIPDLHAATRGLTRYVFSAVAVILTLLAVRPGSPQLVRAGAMWWWLAVLPVLPLPGRTYLHYLYVPLAGLALVAAGIVEAALARRARAAAAGRTAWAVASLALLLYAAWNDVLLAARVDLRMPVADWPLDPVTRKSEIARRAIGDVRQTLAGQRAHVAILIPASVSRNVDLGTGQEAEDQTVRRYVLREVLDDGRSLKALVPAVDSVAIVHDYEPGREGWAYFVSRSDAHVLMLGRIPAAHARFVEVMLGTGFTAAARDYVNKAVADRPGDPMLRALQARAAVASP
jgi:hypothetical protein